MEINVYNDSSFKYLPEKKVINAIKRTFRNENIKKAVVNVIYVNDDKIHELNRNYLKHDRTTDVITFSLSDDNKIIEGEIYISVETAAKQAEDYKNSLTEELLRLSVHGALHLAGYADNTKNKREIMHNLETKYITR